MRKFSNISVIDRLAWLCSISIFVVLLVLSYFLYSNFIGVIDKVNNQSLRDEVVYIKSVIDKDANFVNTLEHELSWLPYFVRQENEEVWVLPYDYVRVLDKRNHVLLETPGMNVIILSQEFMKYAPSRGLSNTIVSWVSPNSRHYLLMSDTVIPKWDAHESITLQIALDVTMLEKIVAKYRYVLLITILMAAIITAFLGRLIAKHGMSALARLTKITEGISIQRGDTKINPQDWPAELNPLIKALNKTIDQIQSNYQRLAQFSANLAHQVRTPINNLIGATEVVLNQPRPVKEYQQLLMSNLEEFRRITDLVNRLLFLARADSLNCDLDLTRFNVAVEFELSCNYFQVLADEKNISLNHESDVMIKADIVLFRQALNNLIANAIDNTNEKGMVRVIAKQSPHSVIIQVIDNGNGIPKEEIPKLFDRFYQIQTAKVRKGTGLGLSIVKSIMQLHKGSVVIDSQIDVGTTVTLEFPLVRT